MEDPGDHVVSQPEPVDNRVFLLVLQHPQERREPRGTAAATVAALRRAKLVTGLSWPNLARALGGPADPRRWAVLYLGSIRPGEVGAVGEIVVLGREGGPLPDPAPILRGLAGIVLLDGTWREAKTLWWRNPWLLKLYRIVLNPPRPARIGTLRREPRREALSTIEAAALILAQVETGPQAAEALLRRLEEHLVAQRRPRRSEITA